MKFRYDIGALRAISVLIVMLFHFNVPGFTGGFIGVDVFFVISGFLMTKIIFSGLDQNKFTFLHFYERRGKRIIPALLFLLVGVLVISNLLFFLPDNRLNSKYVALSAAFVSNVYFWLYSGYFDPSSQSNILLHTWSLSVEWQFYLLYPILLYPLRKLSKQKRRFVLVALGMASLVMMLLITKDHNNFAFYMFPTRAWEMLAGGIAVLYASENRNNSQRKISAWLAVSAYLGILLCNYFISENDLWPSWLTLLPVIFTFIILIADADIPILRSRLIQYIGNISYSLYLWHWPVRIVFLYFGFLRPENTVYMILLSVFFANVSYYLIEKSSATQIMKRYLAATAVIIFVAVTVFKYPDNVISKKVSLFNNADASLTNYQENYLSKSWDKQFNPCGCYMDNTKGIKDFNFSKCLTPVLDKRNILMLGDSHSAMFSASIRRLLPESNIMEASASYTFPLLYAKGRKDAAGLMNKVYENVIPEQSHKIDVVLISASWLMYHNNTMGYKKEELINRLNETLKFIENKGVKVYVIGQTENYVIPYPRVLLLKKIMNINDDYFIDKESQEINSEFKKSIHKKNYIDVYNVVENRYDAKSKTPYNFDGNHLSQLGADEMMKKILMITNNFSR